MRKLNNALLVLKSFGISIQKKPKKLFFIILICIVSFTNLQSQPRLITLKSSQSKSEVFVDNGGAINIVATPLYQDGNLFNSTPAWKDIVSWTHNAGANMAIAPQEDGSVNVNLVGSERIPASGYILTATYDRRALGGDFLSSQITIKLKDECETCFSYTAPGRTTAATYCGVWYSDLCWLDRNIGATRLPTSTSDYSSTDAVGLTYLNNVPPMADSTCPNGWELPTNAQLDAYFSAAGGKTNVTSLYNGPLKLVLFGYTYSGPTGPSEANAAVGSHGYLSTKQNSHYGIGGGAGGNGNNSNLHFSRCVHNTLK